MAESPRFAQLELVGGEPAAAMDWGLFTRLLGRLGRLERLHLEGSGEPMRHPRFFDAVAHAAVRGVRVSAATGLDRLERGGERRLLECGLDSLSVALDGATRETYEFLRPESRFSRVLRHLSAIRRAKERAGAVHPRLALSVTAAPENLHELPAVVRLARRLGIAGVIVLGPPRGGSGPPEDPERLERCTSRARQTARECGVDLRLPEDAFAAGGRLRLRLGLHVSWDGRASACRARCRACELYRVSADCFLARGSFDPPRMSPNGSI